MRDGAGAGWRGVAFAGLMMLGHWLFFGQAVGASLAVFAVALIAAVLALRGRRVTRGDAAVLAGVALALLPVVEKVTPLSLGFLVGGVAVGAVALWRQGGWAQAAVRLIASVPWQVWADAWRARHAVPRMAPGPWVMPLVVGAAFAGLMVAGNPVLEGWLTGWRIDPAGAVERVAFWGLMGMLIWPLLVAGRDAGWLTRAVRMPGLALPGFNAASVARALMLFNAMFAVQTGLDAAYLWGGAVLPDGMSYAQYAHRGAYPLLATALLAGVFALICRPFLGTGRALRGLLILWLLQNVLLVASALLRLDLYVAAYGLTHLRIAAGLWMGLVAAGLGLTAWQVWAGRSNRWLIGVNAGLGLAVLYAGCFVNVAGLIADDGRARMAAGLRVDLDYVCGLGPDAAGRLPVRCIRGEAPVVHGWRDWGFRAARIQGRLSGKAETGE